MNKEARLIYEIQCGNEAILDQIYVENRVNFLRFGKKLISDTAALEDIYQDAIIAFYENVSSGSVTRLKSSIATYITAIGKFMIYKHLRKNNMLTTIDDISQNEIDAAFYKYAERLEDDNEELVTGLEHALQKLGEPCQTLLRLFYYEGKDNSYIMKRLHYSSTNVVKSQKYRCLRYLKQLLQSSLPDGRKI